MLHVLYLCVYQQNFTHNAIDITTITHRLLSNMKQERKKQLISKIRNLPQFRKLDADAVAKWIYLTDKIDKGRLEWHVSRASGFGGSEMGALIATLENRPHRMTANRIIKDKLFITPPKRPNVDMKRGLEMEDYVQQRFEDSLNKNGVSWHRRDDLVDKVFNMKNPDYSWMRSSLDAVYDIDGATTIVDFKAPMPQVLEDYKKYGNYRDYIVQLHHYRMDAQCKNIGIENMLLAMYDYKSNGIEAFEVEYDMDLCATILDAGDFYWNKHVLRGIVPDLNLPDYAIADEDIPDDIKYASKKYINSKIIADNVKSLSDDLRKKVEIWINDTGRLDKSVLLLSDYMQIKGSPEFDCDSAIERLKELGWSEGELDKLRLPDSYDKKKIEESYDSMLRSVERLHESREYGKIELEKEIDNLISLSKDAPIKEKGRWDENKIKDAIVSCNENPEMFITEKLSSGLPRGKNDSLDELKGLVQEEVWSLIDHLSNDNLEIDLNINEAFPLRTFE